MNKILVANRGEIAVRIINACHELGFKTVAVYSEADTDSLHVKYADEAYKIGGASAKNSYLDAEKIVMAAKITNCDAIHPGYGFLSEDLKFISLVEANKISFIGPTLKSVKLMANKFYAKELVKSLGIPVIPYISELVKSKKQLIKIIDGQQLLYPLLLKVASGGGGKGIKFCMNRQEAIGNYDLLIKEARSSFGTNEIYVEKALKNFTHVEVQVLGDGDKGYWCLGERNCTLQRKMQKMVEESPSPCLPNKVRTSMFEDALKICRHLKYKGAGTVEFLFDRSTQKLYFMEMNTRIQVEHAVSELISGVDIVKKQIEIANGLKLSEKDNIKVSNRFSIECRILAESVDKNFLPSVGTISGLIFPMCNYNVRVDSHIYSGYKVTMFYDSLLAKIIVMGNTREEAINKMIVSLNQTEISGVQTNIALLKSLIMSNAVQSGKYDSNTFTEFLLSRG